MSDTHVLGLLASETESRVGTSSDGLEEHESENPTMIQEKGWIRRSQPRAEALLYLAKASLR